MFKRNDRVRVKWNDCKWYNATIDKYFTRDNDYDVIFDQCNSIGRIRAKHIEKYVKPVVKPVAEAGDDRSKLFKQKATPKPSSFELPLSSSSSSTSTSTSKLSKSSGGTRLCTRCSNTATAHLHPICYYIDGNYEWCLQHCDPSSNQQTAAATASTTSATPAVQQMFQKNDLVCVKWGSKWFNARVNEYFTKKNEYDVLFDQCGSIGRISAKHLKNM